MAIDDNTTYGLTGAQVKDLAGKINGGTIKTLTTADYDYPTNNPTSVAAWKLDPGIYKAGESIEVKYSTTASVQKATLSAGDMFAVLGKDGSSNNRKTILYTKSGYLYAPTVDSLGVTYTTTTGDLGHGSVLTMDDLSNSITSPYNTRPAAQNAVRLLNEKVEGIIKTNAGAPATNTVGNLGQLLEDTTNAKLYICTAVTAQGTTPESYTYTWIEVGAGGGSGVTILTTADYDWHYSGDTDDGVSLWNKTPGIYIAEAGVKVYYGSYYDAYNSSNFRRVMSVSQTNSNQVMITMLGRPVNNRLASFASYTSNGNNVGSEIVSGATYLKGDDIKDSLTSTATTGVLSANQGKVLNDKIEGRIKTNAGAPTTSTVGTVGQLLEDTTNGKLYICTDATNPYVWEEIDYSGLTTLSYGNSTWNDFLTAYNAGKIVYCRASSNANPATGSQTRMAFMAYINNPTTPTEVEFQYVRSVSSKTAAQPCDQVFVYKLTSASGGTWTVASRDMTYKVAAGTNVTTSYSNGTVTINADAPVITMQSTDPGEGAALAANNFIAVYDAS